MKINTAFWLVSCLVSGSLVAASASQASPLTLEAIVSEVLSNNPSLKAARANWEAMKERIPQARAWDDPRAGLDVNAGRFVDVPANSFTDQKFVVEQTLPISGRNRLRGRAASAEAVSAFEELHGRELELTLQSRAAYFRFANADAQLALNRKNVVLLKELAGISRSKYEVGTHSQADVLSAETELARLEEAAFDIERTISEATTQLNSLMNRPPDWWLDPPPPLAFEPVTLRREDLESEALAHYPRILIAAEKVHAAEARLAVARKGWIPDPSARLEGDRYNNAGQAISELTVGFSVNLPWFNRAKYSAAIRENQQLLAAAQHELESVRLETLGRLRDQLKTVETYHHHTELFQSKLLPLARQTVTAKRRSYETDKSSFAELLSAQQNLQEMEAMYQDHLVHYEIALAELEPLAGTSWGATIFATKRQKN